MTVNDADFVFCKVGIVQIRLNYYVLISASFKFLASIVLSV
jgi:hypothetical protein